MYANFLFLTEMFNGFDCILSLKTYKQKENGNKNNIYK